MNHRDVVEKLQDFHFGKLAEPERARLDEHLGSCPDCRSLSETYAALHRAIAAQRRAAEDHPSPADVVSLALSGDGMDVESRHRVEDHLGGCVTCAEDVARIREAEASAIEGEEIESRRWAPRFALPGPMGVYALAASLLAAALLYPAFLGLTRYPELRQRTADLARTLAQTRERVDELGSSLKGVRAELDRSVAWSGPVDVVFLSSAMRGVKGIPTVAVDPARPHVVLGAEFDVPRRADAADSVELTLTRNDGATMTDVTMSIKEAREEIRTAGVVTLLVPTSLLAPGEYRLEVRYRKNDVDTELLKSNFEVTKQ